MKYVSLPFHFGPANGFGVGILHLSKLAPNTGDIITPRCVGPKLKRNEL